MSEIEKSKWVSARIGTEAYKTVLTTDTHTIIGDEPVDMGGKDTGVAPGDLLRMSLASCTAITLRMYADRKGFDVREIEVKVNSESVPGKTVFNTQINIYGTITDEQKQRMLQIAKLCPIHKVLTNTIETTTSISQLLV